jgi:predicted RNase H-like HicB family nuclease
MPPNPIAASFFGSGYRERQPQAADSAFAPYEEIPVQYPICIEWGDEHTATGIQIPDIPGAVTAGDTFEAAYSAAIEIAHVMLEELAREGQAIPLPSPTGTHRANPDFEGMGWGMLDIDITPYLGKTEKVNVTLPGYVIQRIDRFVREHNIKSRSSFLADAAMEKLGR